MEFSSEVIEVGSVRRDIVINIPELEVSKGVTEKLKSIAKKVKVDGFRPGKVPFNIVKGRFEEEAKSEVINDLLSKALSSVVVEHKLDYIGNPEISPKSVTDGVSIVASIWLIPSQEFDYSKIEIIAPESTVTEEQINKSIKNILRSKGQKVSAPDKEIDTEDIVSGEVRVLRGEHESFKEKVNFLVGEGRIKNEIEQAVIGKKQGEVVSVTISNPSEKVARDTESDSTTAELEQSEVWEITINEVFQLNIPELTDSVAMSISDEITGVDDLKDKIREGLQEELNHSRDETIRENLLNKLVEECNFEIPDPLLIVKRRELLNEVYGNFSKTAPSYETLDGEIKAEVDKQALVRAKNHIIIRNLVRDNEINVTIEEEKDLFFYWRVDFIKRGIKLEDFDKYHPESKLRLDLKEQLFRQKALDSIKDKITIHG
jgi:trigger factor